MNDVLRIILIASSVLFFVYIAFMVKKNHMALRFSLIWIFFGIFILLLAFFNFFGDWLASLLHIQVASNAVFLLVLLFILLILFTFSIWISKADERIRKLTQEVALMKSELEK